MLFVNLFLEIALISITGYMIYLTYSTVYTTPVQPDNGAAKKLLMFQGFQMLLTIILIVMAFKTTAALPVPTY